MKKVKLKHLELKIEKITDLHKDSIKGGVVTGLGCVTATLYTKHICPSKNCTAGAICDPVTTD